MSEFNSQGRRGDIPWQQLITQPTDLHAGLWFDKGLADQNQKARLVREVAGLGVPQAYYAFVRRWAAQLEGRGAQLRLGTARGRLAVGIGAEAVIDNSLALHHTYGVPLIPGSALKGLAAAYAHQCLADERWHKETKETKQANRSASFGKWARHFFGSLAERGNVCFYDALWVPHDDKLPLVPDVINVHHQGYYGKGEQPPADWDSPVPIPLLSAHGSYLFALEGGADEVDATWQILRWALDELGVGAKTSSGYGRINLEPNNCDAAKVAELAQPAKQQSDQQTSQGPTPAQRQPLQQRPAQQPAPERRAPAQPVPLPVPKAGYEVGEEISPAEVVAIEDEGMIVKLPRGGYGLIEPSELAGKRYQPKQKLRVKVIDVQPGPKGNKVLLRVVPPKPKP
jgi:CRISPR-associated protein Cmr6